MKSLYCYLICLLFSGLLSAQVPVVDWERAFGGSSWEEMHTLVGCRDGGVLLAAITQSPDDGDISTGKLGDWDYWLIKLDVRGNEQWQQRYGGNKADRIWVGQETADGGFLIGGESQSDISDSKSEPNRGNWDFWLMKLDNEGNLLWDKTLGGEGWDALRGDVLETEDGGYLLAGVSDSNSGMDKSEDGRGLWDFWIVKLNANGDIEWDKTYGGDQRELLQAVLPMPDGGYLLGGESRSGVSGDKDDFSRGISDYWLIRVDERGNLLWQKTIGGNYDEAIFDMVLLDEIVYLAGFSGSDATFEKSDPSYGSIDYWVVAVDLQGNQLWDKVYGGSSQDNAYDIRVTEGGNLLLGGYSRSPKSGSKQAESKGEVDFWLVHITPDGEQLWDAAYGGSKQDVLTEMELLADGSIIMSGHTGSPADGDKMSDSRGFNDVWVVKTGCGVNGQLPSTLSGACLGDTLNVTAQFNNCVDCTFLWNDGSTDSLRQFLDLIEPLNLTVQAIDQNGCFNYDTITVAANPLRDVQFDLFPVECGYEIEVGDIEGGFSPYTALLYPTGSNTALSTTTAKLTPGDQFLLEVSDAQGCVWDSLFQAGTAAENLMVTLGEEQIISLGDSLIVQAQTNRPVVDMQWTSNLLSACADCDTYRILPLEPGYITVEVMDELGCRARAKMEYYIDRNYDLFIPTAFSPNNDGQNDNFIIYGGEQVARIDMFRVFDRWGRLVFERRNFPPNDPAFSWNGYFNNQISPSGLYVFYAEVAFIDGRTQLFEGDFLLMN